MLEIQLGLDKWREERHLSPEQQIKGYAANITEELAELLRAINSNNEHEIIDALCDLSVFTMNLRILKDNEILCLNSMIDTSNRKIDNYLEELRHTIEHITLMIKFGVDLSITGEYQEPQINVISFLNYLFNSISHLGYDPKKCMEEVLKEINDRTGHWDENIKKFVKDKKDNLYKADFTKCKKEI